MPNDEKKKNVMKEKKEFDLLICYISCGSFFFLFVAIEYLQTHVMTNLSIKEKTPLYIFIAVTIILIGYFLHFSSNLRNDYKLKITL
jgi:hypothetical protein